MLTANIIQEIQRLPLSKKIFILEQTVKAIKNDDTKKQMILAAKNLHDDYVNDSSLTIFTQLDFDDFYETK